MGRPPRRRKLTEAREEKTKRTLTEAAGERARARRGGSEGTPPAAGTGPASTGGGTADWPGVGTGEDGGGGASEPERGPAGDAGPTAGDDKKSGDAGVGIGGVPGPGRGDIGIGVWKRAAGRASSSERGESKRQGAAIGEVTSATAPPHRARERSTRSARSG